MKEEMWKGVRGYSGMYWISNQGRVFSTSRNTIITGGYNQYGYKIIALCVHSVSTTFLVHRLVAIHFVENPNDYPHVNHKDGIKDSNSHENLEWCTPLQNTRHAIDLGLRGETGGGHFGRTWKVTNAKPRPPHSEETKAKMKIAQQLRGSKPNHPFKLKAQKLNAKKIAS